MAQLRAKQVKLNAGDLILGNGGSNILPFGADKTVLKVVGTSVVYGLQQAGDVVFAPGASGLSSTDVNSAVVELAGDLNAASIALTTVDNALNTSLVAETTRATTAEGALNTSLVAETSRATGAEGVLATNLANEVSRAGATETSLATALSNAGSSLATALAAEASRALGAETALGTSLTTAISNEASTARAAEVALGTSLTSLINVETIRAQGAESTLTSNLNAEISRAESVEADLQAELDLTQASAGLQTSGAYNNAANSLSSYLVSATTLAGADLLLDAAIEAEVVRAEGVETAIYASLASVTSSAGAALAAEISRATGAEASLAGALSTEITNRGSAETAIYVSLAAETLRAGNAEGSLAGALATETSRAQDAETVLTTNLSSEASTARAAERTLTNNLASEVSRAGAAEASLAGALAAEASRALAAEGVVAAAVVTEQSRATAAELTLTTNLANEVSRATGAEGVLTTNLATEVARAGAAELAITLALTAEASRANAAEGVLRASLAAELARATAAEGTLTTNLAGEVTRAEASEGTINARLDSLTAAQVAYVPGTFAGHLTDTNVQSAIDDLASKVNAIGSAFEYQGSVSLGGAIVDASPRQGDVFKILGTGEGTITAPVGTTTATLAVEAGDSVVWDGVQWDVLAHVDSQVFGVAGSVDVTGSTDVGFTVSISPTYVGQTSLVTLGTVTAGVWNASTVAVAHGGTGVTSFEANGIVLGNGSSALGSIAAPVDVLTGTVAGFLQWSGSAFTWVNLAGMRSFLGATSSASEDFVGGAATYTPTNTPVGAVSVFVNGLKLANAEFSGTSVVTLGSLGYTVDALDVVTLAYNYNS